MTKTSFGTVSSGKNTLLYTIENDGIIAKITDFGATLVSLFVPDKNGNTDDIVLGYDSASGYENGEVFFGATVGRNANRIKGASFIIDGKTYNMPKNEGNNNLHSGPDFFCKRMWTVEKFDSHTVTLSLYSPDGDMGFPGNAKICVTYTVEEGALKIEYDAVSDADTVFNMTNHSYFNLSGHQNPSLAMKQFLTLSATEYTAADGESIPTENRLVSGTPMDFRAEKQICRDIDTDFEALNLQGGYDHNFVLDSSPAVILENCERTRKMSIYTDCAGVQFYAGNYLKSECGKNGAHYGYRSGVCLETQFFPDALSHPNWKSPITKAGIPYHSQTVYSFK